jgi:hypothetical protein
MLSISFAFNIRTKILSTAQEIYLFGERLGGRVRDFRSVIFCVITHPPAADYMHGHTSNFIFIQLVTLYSMHNRLTNVCEENAAPRLLAY